MNEMENSEEGPSVTGVNNDASTSADITLPNRPRQSSKKCKKCGNIVKNLSGHQDEVQGMSKIKCKLDAYINKEKKAPKRWVKFCLLSPCKRAKTPIFQLDKHLQTRIDNLKPNTPAYLAALAQAPRASLSKLENCLKKERKRRSEDKREHQQANAEEHQTEREGKDETEARNEDDTTEVERMECNWENIPKYKDDDYKEMTTWAQNIIERRAKSIKRKKPKKAKPRRMKNEVDSDEEYESLANKVWMKNLEVEERALNKAQPRRGKTIRDYDEDYTQLLRGMCNKNYEKSRMTVVGKVLMGIEKITAEESPKKIGIVAKIVLKKMKISTRCCCNFWQWRLQCRSWLYLWWKRWFGHVQSIRHVKRVIFPSCRRRGAHDGTSLGSWRRQYRRRILLR